MLWKRNWRYYWLTVVNSTSTPRYSASFVAISISMPEYSPVRVSWSPNPGTAFFTPTRSTPLSIIAWVSTRCGSGVYHCDGSNPYRIAGFRGYWLCACHLYYHGWKKGKLGFFHTLLYGCSDCVGGECIRYNLPWTPTRSTPLSIIAWVSTPKEPVGPSADSTLLLFSEVPMPAVDSCSLPQPANMVTAIKHANSNASFFFITSTTAAYCYCQSVMCPDQDHPVWWAYLGTGSRNDPRGVGCDDPINTAAMFQANKIFTG